MKKYTVPIIKILLCSAVTLLLCNMRIFLYIANPAVDKVVGVVSAVTVLFCILQIYLAAADMIHIHDANSKVHRKKAAQTAYKTYQIDEILALVERDSIIDLTILSDNGIISIGSSSDCEMENSNFYDKLFYIEGETFENADAWKARLLSITSGEKIKVTAIDGFPARQLKK